MILRQVFIKSVRGCMLTVAALSASGAFTRVAANESLLNARKEATALLDQVGANPEKLRFFCSSDLNKEFLKTVIESALIEKFNLEAFAEEQGILRGRAMGSFKEQKLVREISQYFNGHRDVETGALTPRHREHWPRYLELAGAYAKRVGKSVLTDWDQFNLVDGFFTVDLPENRNPLHPDVTAQFKFSIQDAPRVSTRINLKDELNPKWGIFKGITDISIRDTADGNAELASRISVSFFDQEPDGTISRFHWDHWTHDLAKYSRERVWDLCRQLPPAAAAPEAVPSCK